MDDLSKYNNGNLGEIRLNNRRSIDTCNVVTCVRGANSETDLTKIGFFMEIALANKKMIGGNIPNLEDVTLNLVE